MNDENLIWRKNLFITRGAHRAACSRKEVMNEEVPRRAGAHSKRAPISSSPSPFLAERARRLRMRATSRAIPQEEGARLWKGCLLALSLREDLGDSILSGPCPALAGEGLGGGLLRGVGRSITKARSVKDAHRCTGAARQFRFRDLLSLAARIQPQGVR